MNIFDRRNIYVQSIFVVLIFVLMTYSGLDQIFNQYTHYTTANGRVIELYGDKAVRSGLGHILIGIAPLGILTRNRFFTAIMLVMWMMSGVAVILSIRWMP
jgi:hypothetical protein